MTLLALAISPSIALFLLFYLRDKYDREPLWLMAVTFALGALSIFPVAMIEHALFKQAGLNIYETNGFMVTLMSMIVLVALVEEFTKFAIVRWYCWDKKAFNEPYDGIMYTLMASLGFATAENISYVTQYGEVVGWLRAFLTVPMHALTAVVMGFYIGLAKYPKVKGKNRYLIHGVGIATLTHGFFNTFVSSRYGILIIGAAALVSYAWMLGLRASRLHAENSPYNPSK